MYYRGTDLVFIVLSQIQILTPDIETRPFLVEQIGNGAMVKLSCTLRDLFHAFNMSNDL